MILKGRFFTKSTLFTSGGRRTCEKKLINFWNENSRLGMTKKTRKWTNENENQKIQQLPKKTNLHSSFCRASAWWAAVWEGSQARNELSWAAARQKFQWRHFSYHSKKFKNTERSPHILIYYFNRGWWTHSRGPLLVGRLWHLRHFSAW